MFGSKFARILAIFGLGGREKSAALRTGRRRKFGYGERRASPGRGAERLLADLDVALVNLEERIRSDGEFITIEFTLPYQV